MQNDKIDSAYQSLRTNLTHIREEEEEKEEPWRSLSKVVRETIRILNTNKSTLKSHIDERAIDDYEASPPPPEAFAESVAGGMDNVSIVVEKISVLPLVEEKKISRPGTPKPSTNIIQGAEDHATAEEEGCP
jgi:hypothetical protein